MIEVSHNIEGLLERLGENLNLIDESFDIDEWRVNPDNLLLEEYESFGMFEEEATGVYAGHYMFRKDVRGEKAIDLADRMIDYMFQNGMKVVHGLTPLEHRGAQGLSKELGLKDLGVIETLNGLCTHYLMTKQEFYDRRDERHRR